MKPKKNLFLLRKIYFVFIKIVLWIVIGCVFINISLIIPSNNDSLIRELIIFFCLVGVVTFHTSFLYTRFFKKKRWRYIMLFLISILFCTGFEMLIHYDNLASSYNTFSDSKTIFLITFIYIFIRDFAIFIFFHWVDYSNHFIILYHKNELIHKKEILLLKEKQEFEKNFAKKTLLPHYFFNILEYVGANYLIDKNYREVLDKFKFILYYFLVDTENDFVELDKEIVFYKYYIELEKLRHSEKISVDFCVLGQTENYLIIPLLFEPIIGNAMKYTKQDGTGKVEILIDTTHFPLVLFCCKNNCLNNAHIVSVEKGLKIFKQRLDLCYKHKYSLKVNQNLDFFEVELRLNLV